MPPALATVLRLVASNAFMAYAWYGHHHDGRRDGALWLAIAGCWLIALPEYCFAVPDNRLGRATLSLNLLHEGIGVAVFLVIAMGLEEGAALAERVGVRPDAEWAGGGTARAALR